MQNIFIKNFNNFYNFWKNAYLMKSNLNVGDVDAGISFAVAMFENAKKIKLTKKQNETIVKDYENLENFLNLFIKKSDKILTILFNNDVLDEKYLFFVFQIILVYFVSENFNFKNDNLDVSKINENYYKQNLNKIDPKLKEKFLIEVV